jgi:hypothetical protein
MFTSVTFVAYHKKSNELMRQFVYTSVYIIMVYKHTMHFMYYMFRLIAAIIWYMELLNHIFFLPSILLYTSQCLHIESVLCWCVVYIMFLSYKVY